MILKLYSHLKKNPTKQTFKGKEDRAGSCFQKALGLAVSEAGAPTRVVRIGIKCHVGALIPHPSITLFCSAKVLVGKSREFHLSPRFPQLGFPPAGALATQVLHSLEALCSASPRLPQRAWRSRPGQQPAHPA